MPFGKRDSQVATIKADGTGTITFRPQRDPWRVSQVSMSLPTAPAGSTAFLRLNSRFVSFMISTGDVAAGDPPIDLFPGDLLTVSWEDCTPGQVGEATAFYDTLDWSGAPK